MVLNLESVDVRCGDGWISTIERMLEELNEAKLPIIGMVCDEDQGRLRVDYYLPEELRDQSRDIARIVVLAEFRSLYVCEQCGCPGEHRRNADGWRVTRCLEHQTPDIREGERRYDEVRRPWRRTPDGDFEYDPGADRLVRRP